MTGKKNIYYIGFYCEGNSSVRYSMPAAVNKMKYIAESLKKLGHNVQIISLSWLVSRKYLFRTGKTVIYHNSFSVRFVPSISSPFKITKLFSRYFSLLWLFFLLIKNTNKESNVLIYHSTFFYPAVYLAKKIKRFRMVLEIEEIYYLFTKSNKLIENKMLSLADSYILVNKKIRDYFTNINDRNKPFIVVNGVYKTYKIFPDNKDSDEAVIKVVFAGNIEEIRKGAFNSVLCSKYLSEKYKVVIIGSGKDNAVRRLVAEIKKVNLNSLKKKCEYLGVKYGNDYDEFLANCNIAINPQQPDEQYMQFAFPSKILSYLGHNLRTITTHLSAIVDSEFGDLVVTVQNPDPQRFAEAIMSVNLQSQFDAMNKIKQAHLKFLTDLKLLFV